MLRVSQLRTIVNVIGSPHALKSGAVFCSLPITKKTGQLSKASVNLARQVSATFAENERFVVVTEMSGDANKEKVLSQLAKVDLKRVLFHSEWLDQIGLEYAESMDQLFADDEKLTELLTQQQRIQLMLLISDWMFMAEHHDCTVQIVKSQVKDEWAQLACSKLTTGIAWENLFKYFQY